ncbi:MAG: V-type ATP synthase subunit I [Clostridia bacterium]|nr:V-type ATP synthase subunit I [Clostridia bacterium]
MIAKMKKISVIGLKTKRKAVMELLQKTASVEFVPTKDAQLEEVDVSNSIIGFERYLSAAKQALALLDEYAPEKTGMFAMRKSGAGVSVSMQPGEAKQMGDFILGISTAHKRIGEITTDIARLHARISALTPWVSLDVPLNTGGTRSTLSALAVVQGDADEKAIAEMLGDAASNLYFEIVSRDKECTRVFFMFARANKEQAERAIREAGFVPPAFNLSHLSARDKIKQLEERIETLKAESESKKQEILEAAKRRDEIQLFHDRLVMRKDKYIELEKLKQTESTFVMYGYVPAKKAEKIEKLLVEKTGSYVEINDISEEEEAPILLENNAFAKPVESITTTYSMPGKTDIDPNPIMAFFYYLFFGMMFSDAGYGLLMVLVCGYLGFFAKVEQSTKNNMRMFFYCGVSTTFWGIMYGGFFGDLIPGLKPVWINPIEEPLMLLIFSVGLGIIQIIVGLLIKFYMQWRQKDRWGAIFDEGFWVIILVGACVMAGGMFAEKYAYLSDIGMYMMIGGAVGLILTQGRNEKSIIMKVGSGIISLYDVTGYVSDALSYSRLMALGLATGVIGNVVNTMGRLAGGGAVGIIVFVVIFIIGHLINFALNCLGAYVHTNRLQYVEFFAKFYEGGGREFAPLKMDTKYYIFTEE